MSSSTQKKIHNNFDMGKAVKERSHKSSCCIVYGGFGHHTCFPQRKCWEKSSSVIKNGEFEIKEGVCIEMKLVRFVGTIFCVKVKLNLKLFTCNLCVKLVYLEAWPSNVYILRIQNSISNIELHHRLRNMYSIYCT